MNRNGIRSSLEPLDILEDRVDDGVTAYAGLPIVIEAWYAFGLDKVCEEHLKLRKRQKGLSDAQWAEVLTVLILAGGRTIEDLDGLRMDGGLCRMWPMLKKASARSALNYLHRFHEPKAPKSKQGKALILEEGHDLLGLAEVNRHLIGELQRRVPEEEATIDVDASVHESQKREALWTYEGVQGYQPVIAYWAEQRVIVADQFRDGNVPAGMGNKEFVEGALSSLPDGLRQRRVRGDTALYEKELLHWLEEKNVKFGISADMTVELREEMKNLSESKWNKYLKITKEGKRKDTGKQWAEVPFVPGEKNEKKEKKPFRYVGIRIPKKEPDLFDGAYEYFALATNIWGMGANEFLNWQRGRCGTVEWGHDVLKNDLGARTFPSNKFGANAAWYRFNVLAFNLKTALTKVGLPKYAEARPHTLRLRLLHLAGRVVSHSRKLSMIMASESSQGRDDLVECCSAIGSNPA